MKFNQEYRQRYINQFGEESVNGMISRKWLNENTDIKEYIDDIFKKEPRYKTFGNALWCFIHNFDIDEYKCKQCRKINDISSSNSND